jgi:hypothetical protein
MALNLDKAKAGKPAPKQSQGTSVIGFGIVCACIGCLLGAFLMTMTASTQTIEATGYRASTTNQPQSKMEQK